MWRILVATTMLVGCAEEEGIRRLDLAPHVVLSTAEAPQNCRPMESVEVRSGQRDPTSHELLRDFAAGRGANYIVLDAFGVLANDDDIYAVTRARLFQCPVALVCYRCGTP